MKTLIRKTLTAVAFAIGFTTAATAAATVFTVTSIEKVAQTNFNGSVVTIAYSGYSAGDYLATEVKLTIGNYSTTTYEGALAPGGGTLTFYVPGNVALASNICNAVVTVTGKGTAQSASDVSVAYNNTAWLYQGAPVAGGKGMNGWFSTYAENATVVADPAGAWGANEPLAANSKIIIDEDANGDYNDFVFTPGAAVQQGQAAVIDMSIAFDAALDDVSDAAGLQAAIRLVTTGADAYRFAAVTNGVWTTNTTIEAALNTAYALRLTFDYRQVPATVTYAVKDGDVYKTIASGVSGTTKSTLEKVTFNGSGALSVMTGSNIVDSVDASLVKDAEHPDAKYGNIDLALQAGATNLTLLWNTAWQPPSGTGAFRISKGGYDWYYTPEDGLLVKLEDGVYVVVTDYWEVMNLDDPTDLYMFLTNVIATGGANVTNLCLLRDIDVGAEAIAVNRAIRLTGETNILSGAGFTVPAGSPLTIASGCVGIPYAANVAVESGRFNETTTNSWKSILGNTYVFAELAAPVRPGYKWQLMEKAKAPDPGQELMPITDADGEPVSVVVSNGWAQAVTGENEPAKQSAALSEVQANGMTRLDNEILGLAKSGKVAENNIPVIQPVQTKDANAVTFSLGNVSFQSITNSGARVTYRVYKSDNPGGKDGGSSDVTDPDETVAMPLPSSGVQYYLIEVDTGAVK